MRGAARRCQAPDRRFRPGLESLEDRTLLSANPTLVTNLNDGGPGPGTGTLRAAITYANAHPGSTITFLPGLWHGR
jgi:hypothetical protein